MVERFLLDAWLQLWNAAPKGSMSLRYAGRCLKVEIHLSNSNLKS